MAKIPEMTEQRIKSAAKIEDVLADQGVVLHRRGAQLVGLCPFHDDRSIGSFQVSTLRNMCSCYACGATGLNPIDTLIRLKYSHLSEKEAYPQALRYLAAMYNIPVDDEPVPVVEKKAPILPPPPKRQPIMWHADLVKPFKRYNNSNMLLAYLRSLPMMDEHKAMLEKAINNYAIGTYHNPDKSIYEGWTIWWYIDDMGYVRSGKLMKYKQDGHRDKDWSSNWAHSMMARWKYHKDGTKEEREKWKYDNDTHQPNLNCLFGQHLLRFYPDALIRIVESEKTAIICSAFNDQKQVLWLATGGKNGLSGERFAPLIRQGRHIELYPDIDAYDDWAEIVRKDKVLSAYPRLTISQKVKTLWTEEDGPKADIADIMIRIITAKEVTLGMKVAVKLGHPEKAEVLDEFIKALNLVEI